MEQGQITRVAPDVAFLPQAYAEMVAWACEQISATGSVTVAITATNDSPTGSVMISGKAGIPPTQTCMNCHKQIWLDSPTLEPVRASYRTDPYFGFSVPTSVPGIEPHILYPMKTWKDKAAFDETARKLVRMFQENFVKYEKHVDADVRSAAPEVRIAAE